MKETQALWVTLAEHLCCDQERIFKQIWRIRRKHGNIGSLNIAGRKKHCTQQPSYGSLLNSRKWKKAAKPGAYRVRERVDGCEAGDGGGGKSTQCLASNNKGFGISFSL